MASVDVDLIPGVWVEVSRSGAVTACNRAAREAIPAMATALGWADWLDEADARRLSVEWAGLPAGAVWQGELGVCAAGRHRARVLVLEGSFSVLLGPADEAGDGAAWSDFLGRLCHDARAPVAAVKSSLFLLNRHGQAVQGEREQKWLGAASQSVAGLESLIRAVGVLGEWLGPPRVARRAEPCDLRRVSTEVLESAAGGARFDLGWGADVPARWCVDREAWVTALEPLVRNAFRHAPDGDLVRVRAVAVPGGLSVEVSDGGLGVAEGEEALLFRPFFHARRDAARGLGLGLAQAQAAARASGGRVSYRREGGRTVFCLRIAGVPAAA